MPETTQTDADAMTRGRCQRQTAANVTASPLMTIARLGGPLPEKPVVESFFAGKICAYEALTRLRAALFHRNP
jgi:hypothetical protein